jgi:hypothetical protein
MILRDATTADGSPAWVLISQVDHAHLSGELAEGWREEIPCRTVVLPTIYRHDDGWRAWEAAPTIDPATGRPRSFLDMPHAKTHEIWQKSIAGVADLGPLAQFMVAEHFCRLRRSGEASGDPQVQAFLGEFDGRYRQWLAQWQSENPARNTLAVAERAVDWLQFFDLFSLWLCMADRTQPHQLTLPGGTNLSLLPVQPGWNESTLMVDPWPWPQPSRQLQTHGRRIAAHRLPTDFALQNAIAAAPVVDLSWKLTPR